MVGKGSFWGDIQGRGNHENIESRRVFGIHASASECPQDMPEGLLDIRYR
jgi:hypothetical protein